MEVYKIKNKDNKFSTGGYSPRFTKNGKTWNSRSSLNNHLSQIAGFFDYVDCYLITFGEEGIKEEKIIPIIQEIKKKYYENHKKRYGYYYGYYDNKKENAFIETYNKFLQLEE